MKLDGILGQEHLKKKIYDSIEKKIFPQSKILVDRDGYGGLNLAIEIARGLLEVEKNYKGEILNHPDLYFSYPTFADKQTSPDLLDSWIDLIKKNVYIDFNDWKNISLDSKGKNTEGKIRKAEIDLIFSKAHLKPFVGGAKVFITSVAEIRFKLNDCIKSLFFVNFNGFKSIDPTQKAKPLIGSSFKSFSIFSEKFSSKTSQTVNVEFKFFANSDKLFSSLPTKCTCSPLSTNFFAKEEPIDPVAPKITFFIIKNNIIKGYLHANNDACNI